MIRRAYCALAETCPAEPTVTTPPQAQVHCDASSKALTPAIVTRADPGDHGDSTGWQGCGTSAGLPALAAATCGLAGDMHIPNGGTLPSPMSVTTPAGLVADTCAPEAAKLEGVVPSEHARLAPVHTTCAMADLRIALFILTVRGHAAWLRPGMAVFGLPTPSLSEETLRAFMPMPIPALRTAEQYLRQAVEARIGEYRSLALKALVQSLAFLRRLGENVTREEIGELAMPPAAGSRNSSRNWPPRSPKPPALLGTESQG